MRCPVCHHEESKVVDSRAADDGSSIRRRRECLECTYRFTTYERLENAPLMVVKNSGQRTPFDRDKVAGGVRSACKGRPVEPEQIDALAESVEDEVRTLAKSGGIVTTSLIGHMVLERLRGLDEVAYVRFASVYKNFDDAADFRRELALLKQN
jgi:transcriptional repressor NrdR